MKQFWEQELTDEEESNIIAQLADQVEKRRMETPAILFVEMHKPVANVVAHAMVAFSPFVAPFLGFQVVNDYSRLLRKPGGLERLIRAMEDRRDRRLVTES